MSMHFYSSDFSAVRDCSGPEVRGMNGHEKDPDGNAADRVCWSVNDDG